MKFGIIEIGSTNTKTYIYDNGELINLGNTYIAFKNNFNINNKHLLPSDIEKLDNLINDLKKDVDEIYAFGTSIFRKLEDDEKNDFIKRMKENHNIDFKVVTADEESKYTVEGVIGDIDYQEKMAVVIGGGGSTEIAIIENKEIIRKINLDFGAMDIADAFPDLKDDIATTSFDEMINYTLNLIDDIEENVDTLVLAGGDYIYFYETVGYEMQTNNLYEDNNQPYLINFSKSNEYDHDILTKSLDAIKARCPGNEDWWQGARAMRFCMNAVARKLNVKYIIPTRINMLIGLANEIKDAHK
ncbi:MAG: hypothetical protein K2G03_04590 [Bacilli bacterium]|nr:hypothetical protein [Bacilli bacterium]